MTGYTVYFKYCDTTKFHKDNTYATRKEAEDRIQYLIDTDIFGFYDDKSFRIAEEE